MKFLTRLGKTIVLIPSTIATIASFVFINFSISNATDLSLTESLMFRLASPIFAFVIGGTLALSIISAIIFSSKSQTSDFRTLWHNDQDIEVYVKTYQDELVVAGDYLKNKIVSTSGTLKLKKHSTSISQSIDKIEYLGPNQKDSKVEKIEYSETVYGESLFGLQLLNNFKATHLKVHLKDARSENELEIEESLKSFLYGDQSTSESKEN